MATLTVAELEHFYSEGIKLLADLQDEKLLKKLPGDVSKRALNLLTLYRRQESAPHSDTATPTLQRLASYDSRCQDDTPPPPLTPSDVPTDTVWWQGIVEVKGLLKGQKSVKLYLMCHGLLLSFFPGQKKSLIGQVVLNPNIEIAPISEGKKSGSSFTLAEEDCRLITLKFGAVSNGEEWYTKYGAKCKEDALVEREDSNKASNDNCEEMATIQNPLTSPSNQGNVPPLLSNANGLRMAVEEMKVEEESVEAWGDFQKEGAYQLDWSFNLDKCVLPDQGLLSLQRGQLVLLKEQVNDAWWKVMDCQGNVGFIASCFLSLAFY